MLTGCYDETTAQSLIELFNRDACEDAIGRKGFSQLHKIVLGLAPGDLSFELQTPDGLQAMNSTDAQGSTPLMWAGRAGNLVAGKVNILSSVAQYTNVLLQLRRYYILVLTLLLGIPSIMMRLVVL